MSEETLVVFVYLVVDDGFLTHHLTAYIVLEQLYDALKDGLIEHQLLAIHYTHDIVACEHLAGLEDDTITSGIKNIDPKFLVECLPGENQYLDVWMLFLCVTANLNTYGGGATQSQVEQNEVGQLFLQQLPVFLLVVGGADNVGLGYVVANDADGTFHL